MAKALLIDMPGGVAGDMFVAALLDLGGDETKLRREFDLLGVGKIELVSEKVKSSGLSSRRIHFLVPQEADWSGGSPSSRLPSGPEGGHHIHRTLKIIRSILEKSVLPPLVKARSLRVFEILAEAEGQVHGLPPEEVHFHEVGSLDAICEVVGTCLLLEELRVEKIYAHSLTFGSGVVRCAHGEMPVPVPAVVKMAERFGFPVRELSRDTGELTTPTGCALVCGLAETFVSLPRSYRSLRSGFGAGHRSIPGVVNVLRLRLAEVMDREEIKGSLDRDEVIEIKANLDDATGEQVATVVQTLLEEGALDVWTTPIIMKKGRPGVELSILCDPSTRDSLVESLIQNSPSIGVRYHLCQRDKLKRKSVAFELEGRPVSLKEVTLPDGARRVKPEDESVRRIIKETGRPYHLVYRDILRLYEKQSG